MSESYVVVDVISDVPVVFSQLHASVTCLLYCLWFHLVTANCDVIDVTEFTLNVASLQ